MIAYFYCDTSNNLNAAYHDYISIAEGFTELGIQCYGNRNMYKPGVGRKFLIRYDSNVSYNDAEIVFFHYTLYDFKDNLANDKIKEITGVKSRKFVTVFVDASDGLFTPGYQKGAQSCDIVLKSHYNIKYKKLF